MIIQKLVLNCLAFPPFLLLLVIAFPFLAILWLHRIIVTLILKPLFRRDLKEAISGIELIYSFEKYWNGTREAISMVHVIQGTLDVEKVKQRLTDVILYKRLSTPEEILNYDRLTTLHPLKWMGFVFWKVSSEKFDLEKHVCVVDTNTTTENFSVNRTLVEWLRSPFPKDRPVWSAIIIPGYRNEQDEQKSLVAFRVHHVVSDGYSMVDFIGRLYDEPHNNNSPTRTVNIYTDIIQQLFWSPLTVFNLVNTYAVKTVAANLPTSFKNWLRNNTTSTGRQKMTLITTHFDLSKLKALRKSLSKNFQKQVTFATLIWFLLAGALRRLYRSGHFDATKAKMITRKGQLKFNVGYGTPRRSPHPLRSFCNHWAMNNYSVPFGHETSQERLRQMIQTYSWRETSKIGDMDTWLHAVVTNVLPNSFLSMIIEAATPSVIGLTNLPGSQTLVHLCGAKVEEIYELTGLLYKRYSFTLGCYSYNDRLGVTLSSDNEILNDKASQKLLKTYFREEINELNAKYLNP